MSGQRIPEVRHPADADPVAQSASLPDAPLAMPVQSLESAGPRTLMRMIFGGFNRIVKG
jgi:hypothetical protein